MVDYSGTSLSNDVYLQNTSVTLHTTKIFKALTLVNGTVEAWGTNWNLGTMNFYNWNGGADTINIEGNGSPSHLSPDYVQLFCLNGTINAYCNLNIIGKTAGATFGAGTGGTVHVGAAVKIDASVNNCTLDFFAPRSNGKSLVYNSLEFDRKVDSTTTIKMTNDGKLILKDPREFNATIKDFTGPRFDAVTHMVSRDTLAIAGKNITWTYYQGDKQHGTLMLFSGNALQGNIKFAGDYTHAHFTVLHSGNDSVIRLT